MSKIELVYLMAGLSVVFLLLAFRLRLKPQQVKLPFIHFDVSNFQALTIIKLFKGVTAKVLPASQKSQPGIHPLVLMNAGWMMVCEAFLHRFDIYPTEENVMSVVKYIGPQNAEFINIYRKVYESSVREGDKLNRDFAEAFVTRAPALAQRVSGNQSPLWDFADQQYRKWNLKA